jgi:hypothetical protein
MPRLASANEIGHRADGLFYWDLRIHAVQVVEVDHVDSEAPQ